MEFYIIGLTLAIGLFVYFRLSAPKVTWISKDELNTMLSDKNIKRNFVDVRTSEEFKSKKIKGFQNIPLDQLSKRKSEINVALPVVLICASGSRASSAAKLLSKQGYTQLYNVKGGVGH